jgi:hypothetical protein
MEGKLMKKLTIIGLLVGAFTLSTGITFAQTGNGAPSGPHYNLNIIGVPKNKHADMKDTSGHTIFVPLWGNTAIHLCDSDVCANGGFQVLDRNGTDGDAAAFALPSPDPDGNGTTDYSVFARALGTPGGSADVTTCTTDIDTQEIICSEITMTLNSATRPNKFQNVSKYLLYVYTADGTRVPLFGDGFEDFYWHYDNKGLKLAQLRFYQCTTTVPDGTNPTGEPTDNCGSTGK